MKAAIRSTYGLPGVLSIREIEMPAPKANEVLVRIHATTVNRTDCHVLWGKPFVMRFFTGLFKPRLASTGSDFAGDIAAIGEKAQRFKVGDRVMGFGGVFGCGSHAQYVTFAEKKAITIIPDKLNDEDAAACLEGAIYAASAINFLKPKAGQNALVNGATGAIGSAYVQILKSFGVTVTGTCSGENKTIVQSLGADRVIDYLVEDFTKDTGVYDFIFDAVGKSNFAKCKRLLKHQGIFISSQPNPLNSVITKLFGHKKEIFSPGINIKAELDYIKSLVEKGQFKPVIDRTYPLDKIAEAFNYVATGQKTGNVVITMDI